MLLWSCSWVRYYLCESVLLLLYYFPTACSSCSCEACASQSCSGATPAFAVILQVHFFLYFSPFFSFISASAGAGIYFFSFQFVQESDYYSLLFQNVSFSFLSLIWLLPFSLLWSHLLFSSHSSPLTPKCSVMKLRGGCSLLPAITCETAMPWPLQTFAF